MTNAERSLTFGEAEFRAGLVEVDRYDVEVDLTGLLDGAELRATSTVRFGCTRPGEGTFVDCLAEVEEAVLNGLVLGRDAVGEGRIELSDLEAENVLVVRSVQRNTGRGQGVHRSVDRDDGNVYVWTSFEPDDARRAWACFDQPDLKATWAFTVTAPGGWTVLSNAGTAAVVEAAVNRVWRFTDTPRLSSYNLVVNAGPLHEIRSQRAGFDLGLYASRSLAPMLERDAEELFDLTARGLQFFGERFGMPFPQRRYDQAFMPELSGAMENYGCVTWTDSMIFRDPPTFAEREARARVLLHEMAHMWFGDIVTMRWWDDLWLNESFADWACSWAAEAATQFTDAWAGVLATQKLAGYAADDSPISHPIAAHLPDVAAATGTFDAITYSKGQAALKQLVAFLGEDAFLAGLRAYFAKHAWGNAVMADLIGELEAASGRDLARWTQGWLGTAGTDRLVVERGADGAVLRAEGPGGGAPRPHRLHVGVYDEAGGRLGLRETLSVEVHDPVTRLSDEARTAVLLVNDDDLTFACARPDAESLAVLRTRAGELPTAIGRTVAVTTVWDMLVRGETDAASFVETAAGALATETADSVVEPLLHLAVQAADYWASSSDRDRLCTAVADLCLRVAADREAVGLRDFAKVATTEEQLVELKRRASTRDLRWRRLERLAVLGAVDGKEIDAFEHEDTAPDAWLRAVRARAGLPDAEARQEIWREVFEGHGIPAHAYFPIGQQFWRPEQDGLLAPFAEQLLEVLPAVQGTGLLRTLALVRGMFPTAGVDGDWLDRVDALARAGTLAPVVSNVLLERADRVRRMWRARGAVPVSAR
ncbi:MAG TPA: aminopeptidase N [Nocardioidaceae bacterium]|nr:aminopeptidase N [Nocardioidaceae bacterium]